MRTPQARIEHYLILIFIVQPFLTVPGPFRGWSGSCVHTKGGVCTIHSWPGFKDEMEVWRKEDREEQR